MLQAIEDKKRCDQKAQTLNSLLHGVCSDDGNPFGKSALVHLLSLLFGDAIDLQSMQDVGPRLSPDDHAPGTLKNTIFKFLSH